MPSSINGFGTMYYGKANPQPDGSVVRTEWITALYVPLVPLGSYRVWFQSRDAKWYSNRTVDHYKVLRVPIHVPHLLKGWGITAGLVGLAQLADYMHW